MLRVRERSMIGRWMTYIKIMLRVRERSMIGRWLTYIKVLEAEDVEDADEAGLVLSRVGALVDGVHQPRERTWVQRLGHGVTVLWRLQRHTTKWYDCCHRTSLSTALWPWRDGSLTPATSYNQTIQLLSQNVIHYSQYIGHGVTVLWRLQRLTTERYNYCHRTSFITASTLAMAWRFSDTCNVTQPNDKTTVTQRHWVQWLQRHITKRYNCCHRTSLSTATATSHKQVIQPTDWLLWQNAREHNALDKGRRHPKYCSQK